jgi:spore maturation protein CgeB
VTKSIALIDTYYQEVIRSQGFDGRVPREGTYSENLAELTNFGFGTGGAYVRGLTNAGWRADIVIPNALGLQSKWVSEHSAGPVFRGGWGYGLHLSRLPIVRNMLHNFPHIHKIVLDQMTALKPDVIMVQDLNLIPPGFARALKKVTQLLVGEIASPLPPKPYFIHYDLIVSALPSIVTTARAWGIDSEYIPLGFDPRWATVTPASRRPIEAIFVGSFSRHQPHTTPLLLEAARLIPDLEIYGPASASVLEESGLLPHYRGQAWGKEMFELLGQSKLVLNRHGTIAGDFAVNMRMFETTGAGAVLVTEAKSNLSDLFEPNTEVLAYENPRQAAHLAREILADPLRLDAVAAAGQRRALEHHTYDQRAVALTEILADRLDGRFSSRAR